MNKKANEINFDGIVGPTYSFGGLSFGNIASIQNKKVLSNPKKAALEGLEKMYMLFKLGVKQAVIPPQLRPDLSFLRSLGFLGSDDSVLKKAFESNPKLLLACYSASSMWAANSATCTPSLDASDNRFHITPANLTAKLHRSLEPSFTYLFFKKIFSNEKLFTVHPPLHPSCAIADEGAANHTRFCQSHNKKGIHHFVYGREGIGKNHFFPKKYFPRQTLEASQAIATLHQISCDRVIFSKQHPDAIDAGAFHNDVISVGNENLFLFHEKAFLHTEKTIDNLQQAFQKVSKKPFLPIKIKESEIPLKKAISSYFFNSQIITTKQDHMLFIAPIECLEEKVIKDKIDLLIKSKDNPIKETLYVDVRQSMKNGGGPACLRMRVVLTEEEEKNIFQEIIFSEDLYHKLKKWICKYYRDELLYKDLLDIKFIDEVKTALDELTKILNLGSIYPFQR